MWYPFLFPQTKKRVQIHSAVVLFVYSVAFSFVASALTARGDNASLQVNLDMVIQADFLGVNAVYHGFAFMPEQLAKGMDDADRAREFDRIKRMKLNIARTWYRADWACGEDLRNAFDWKSEKMEAFCKWLAVMQDLDVDIALQSGWWAKDTHMGQEEYNPERDKARYAEWVSESLRYLVKGRGFTNIKYLILFTEPHTSGGHSWEGWKAFSRAIDARLKQDGLRELVKLIGPNNSGYGARTDLAVAEMDDVLDIYGGHDYLQGYEAWYTFGLHLAEIVKPTGKQLWIDENNDRSGIKSIGYTPQFANNVAQMVAGTVNAGNQTSMIWLLFDQQYVAPLQDLSNGDLFKDGVHRWGVCKWPGDDIEHPTYPNPSWYTYSMMSRYLGGRNGTLTYLTGGDVVCGAATAPGGEGLSILVVNPTSESQALTIRLSRALNHTLSRHLYDPANIELTEAAEILPVGKVFEHVGQELRDTLPPLGVAIYTTIQPGEQDDQMR